MQHDPESPYRNVIRDYYRLLDDEIGTVLELLDEDTVVMVVSDHGARALDGGFCVNEWLVREGYLVLRTGTAEVTPFDELDIDWGRTRAWSAGGYYARVFLNVKGREPNGVIEPADYDAVRDELAAAAGGHHRPRRAVPWARWSSGPRRSTREVRDVAPDLIATSATWPGGRSAASGTNASTCRRTTPARTTATTPSTARSCLAGPGRPRAG